MSCGRERPNNLELFLEQLRLLENPPRAVVITGHNIEEVAKAFRALAIAFGSQETRTDQEIYEEATRMFGGTATSQVLSFSSKWGGDGYHRSLAQASDTNKITPIVRAYEWRKVSPYRNEHEDQQARIARFQKYERTKSTPVNRKKYPR